MAPEMTTVVIPLLTIFGSGVVSTFVTYKLNASNAERILMLDKLERLFSCVQDFTTQIITQNMTWFGVMKGDYDYNKALDMNIASGREMLGSNAFKDAEKLVMLYFQELEPNWEEVIKARDATNKILSVFQAGWKEYGPRNTDREFIPVLQTALFKVEEAGKAFAKATYKSAQRYRKRKTPPLLKKARRL